MLRDPADRLDGDRILEESPGRLGFLLWRTARDVTLLAVTPDGGRAALFAEGSPDDRLVLLISADPPGRVSGPINELHAMLSLPAHAGAEAVSLCCLEVAAWARDTGRPHTAVAFAQAGAVAAPTFADAALFVGVCAHAARQSARAETWLRRAVAVARRERNWAAYASALVELGAVYEGRVNVPRAERLYRLALRAALRHHERAERMRAAHALFRMARANEDGAGAARFALHAQLAAEPDRAGAAEVLLDLARFWIETDEPKRACAALRRLVPALVIMEPAGHLTALALTARARAAAGQPRIGSVAWRAAWVLLRNDGLPDSVRYAAAVDLARAAQLEGDSNASSEAMRVALRLASPADFLALTAGVEEIRPLRKSRSVKLGPRRLHDQTILGEINECEP
jgi:tetratricopeptide (TPR) repeat protein